MAYKRILTIQDISCVGQCSMTVALPILSACGHETCILPTAVLSTHTGGFGKPEAVHLNGHLQKIYEHWIQNGISFDAILVGYLGREESVDIVSDILDLMLAPNGISIVDPAMADHGRLYSGLSEGYASKMEALCAKADIILPNVTEAAMFAEMPYKETLDEDYVSQLLSQLHHPCVVLTGIGYTQGQTGIVLCESEKQTYISHKRIEKNFHGTGDMFAACFTGALMQNLSKESAVRIAAEFVYRSIENTVKAPAHWYGVKFETALPKLIRVLFNEKPAE